MASEFDLERYLRHSKKVEIEDLDLSAAAHHPLTDDEARCLTYMMDIEAHTVVYLRSILSTCAIEDPETTAFLSCWAYEEFFHGRALRRFLQACGRAFPEDRASHVLRKVPWSEWAKDLGASLVCQISRHFHAVYLTYGAVSELSTLEGYGLLARRTRNPVLAELLRRLAKDERRHFSFYYNKARVELAPRAAQRLTGFVLRHFWLPVGGGVKPDAEMHWILRYVLGGAEGAEVAARIDQTIARLPGLAWFRGLTDHRERAFRARPGIGVGADDTPYAAAAIG